MLPFRCRSRIAAQTSGTFFFFFFLLGERGKGGERERERAEEVTVPFRRCSASRFRRGTTPRMRGIHVYRIATSPSLQLRCSPPPPHHPLPPVPADRSLGCTCIFVISSYARTCACTCASAALSLSLSLSLSLARSLSLLPLRSNHNMYERREDRNPSRYGAHVALSFLIGIATSSLPRRTTYIIPRPPGIILGKKIRSLVLARLPRWIPSRRIDPANNERPPRAVKLDTRYGRQARSGRIRQSELRTLIQLYID